jgi:ABC-type bacteriocin/lantibiotic exporter with double-glycine peptidase domain
LQREYRFSTPLRVRRYPQHFTEEERSDLDFAWPVGGPEEWGDKCCGLACLRMLCDYYRLPVPHQRELLHEGLSSQAYTPRGWTHQGLVQLAGRHGMTGLAEGLEDNEPLLRLAAEGAPSIISCTWRFPQDGRKGGHLVVFTGEFRQAGARHAGFADPSRWGAHHSSLPSSRFWASWTGRVISLKPTRGGTSW